MIAASLQDWFRMLNPAQTVPALRDGSGNIISDFGPMENCPKISDVEIIDVKYIVNSFDTNYSNDFAHQSIFS
jgi:hypothetical protein